MKSAAPGRDPGIVALVLLTWWLTGPLARAQPVVIGLSGDGDKPYFKDVYNVTAFGWDELHHWETDGGESRLCHCQGNLPCDAPTGCMVCLRPWGGNNQCQHLQLAPYLQSQTNTIVSEHSWLLGPNSCVEPNSPDIMGTLTLELSRNLSFIEIRFQTKMDVITYDKQIKLGLSNEIEDEKKQYPGKLDEQIDMTTSQFHITYTAKNPFMFSSDLVYSRLELEDLPLGLCQVELSLGRNLAYSAMVHSSSPSAIPKQTDPEKAIDGSILSDYERGCYVSESSQEEEFVIKLRMPSVINYIILLQSREDEDTRCQQVGFYLELMNPDMEVVGTYHHESPTPDSKKYPWEIRVYIHANPPEGVQYVKLKLNQTAEQLETNCPAGDGRVWKPRIELCEFLVIGESKCRNGTMPPYCYPCSDGLWGEECKLECPICLEKKCDTENGYCKGCPKGLKGPKCDEPCLVTCKGGFCDQYQDKCVETGCEMGKTGETCTEDCKTVCLGGCNQMSKDCFGCTESLWGPQCNSTCDNCKNSTCSQEDGTCAEGCAVGFQGRMCNEKCPQNCKDLKCDENGKCTGCEDGYFGAACNSECHNCKNDVCDQNSGICKDGCRSGYFGHNCDKKSGSDDDDDNTVFIILVFLLLLLLLSLLALFALRKKKKKKEEGLYDTPAKMDKDASVTDTGGADRVSKSLTGDKSADRLTPVPPPVRHVFRPRFETVEFGETTIY